MEESIESNFKIKALVILIIAALVLAGSAFFNAVKAANLEAGYNRKVYFTGDTMHRSDGAPKKISLFHRGETVRKSGYTEENPGCGIISIINNKAAYPYYVSGEGWIKAEQIIAEKTKKFIDFNFDFSDFMKNGKVVHGLTIDGEYTNVIVDNTNIVKFENGELKIIGDGTTNVKFYIKKDTEIKEINAIAATHNGELTLSLPQESLSEGITASIKEHVDAEIFEKVQVEADMDAKASLNIDEEGVHATLGGTESDEAIISANVTAGEKEIVSGEVTGKGTVDANLQEIKAQGESKQALSILDKIKGSLTERANAKIDREHAELNVGADAKVQDKEVASVDAGVSYKYGDTDPEGSIEGHILEAPFSKSGKIPVVSTIKSLISRMPKLAH